MANADLHGEVLCALREMGAAKHSPAKMKFDIGKLDYALGGSPVWEIFRAAYQMTKSPAIIGGLLIFAGYSGRRFAGISGRFRRVYERFRRREQMKRLENKFFGGSPPWALEVPKPSLKVPKDVR